MSRDKQIEEMAKQVYGNFGLSMPTARNIAKYLTNKKGYRKASDIAEEIFAEIVNPIDRAIQFYDMLSINTFDSIEQAKARASKEALQAFCETLAELKKKYTQEK